MHVIHQLNAGRTTEPSKMDDSRGPVLKRSSSQRIWIYHPCVHV